MVKGSLSVIEAFVGWENCSHAPLQELDNDKFPSADLYCKLVNTFADLKSQKLLATGNFKTLVSENRSELKKNMENRSVIETTRN